VAVVELASPSNKDRPRERNAFAAKVGYYLMSGVCVVLLDVVTVKRFNLLDSLCEILGDTFVPLELEETYVDACRKRKLF
jgi:hypothetical protein